MKQHCSHVTEAEKASGGRINSLKISSFQLGNTLPLTLQKFRSHEEPSNEQPLPAGAHFYRCLLFLETRTEGLDCFSDTLLPTVTSGPSWSPFPLKGKSKSKRSPRAQADQGRRTVHGFTGPSPSQTLWCRKTDLNYKAP